MKLFSVIKDLMNVSESEDNRKRVYGRSLKFDDISLNRKLKLALSGDYKKIDGVGEEDLEALEVEPEKRKELFVELLEEMNNKKIIGKVDTEIIQSLDFEEPTTDIKHGKIDGKEVTLQVIRSNLFEYLRKIGHGRVIRETLNDDLLEDIKELCDGRIDEWRFEITEGDERFKKIKATSGDLELGSKIQDVEWIDTRFFSLVNEILKEENSDYRIFDRKENDLGDYEIYYFTPAQMSYIADITDNAEFFDAYEDGNMIRAGKIQIEKD